MDRSWVAASIHMILDDFPCELRENHGKYSCWAFCEDVQCAMAICMAVSSTIWCLGFCTIKSTWYQQNAINSAADRRNMGTSKIMMIFTPLARVFIWDILDDLDIIATILNRQTFNSNIYYYFQPVGVLSLSSGQFRLFAVSTNTHLSLILSPSHNAWR